MERIKMQRSVWWPCKLIIGDKVHFDGKTYQVMSQNASPQDSYHFKNRFYTFLLEVS